VILLGDEGPKNPALIALRARIVAVRAEIDALRHSGVGDIRCEINPDRISLVGWVPPIRGPDRATETLLDFQGETFCNSISFGEMG